MGSSRIKVRWRCGECNEVHEDEDGARECCMPTIYEIYTCPVCNKGHDDEDNASKCCGFSVTRCPCCARDYGAGHIQAFAVRLAGHCNTCNPFYTIDQQLLIEDQYAQSGAERRSLNA